jgi:hypothetical protein
VLQARHGDLRRVEVLRVGEEAVRGAGLQI